MIYSRRVQILAFCSYWEPCGRCCVDPRRGRRRGGVGGRSRAPHIVRAMLFGPALVCPRCRHYRSGSGRVTARRSVRGVAARRVRGCSVPVLRARCANAAKAAATNLDCLDRRAAAARVRDSVSEPWDRYPRRRSGPARPPRRRVRPMSDVACAGTQSDLGRPVRAQLTRTPRWPRLRACCRGTAETATLPPPAPNDPPTASTVPVTRRTVSTTSHAEVQYHHCGVAVFLS